MMEKKYIKLIIIAGVVISIVVLAAVTGVGEKLGRLGVISVNIAKSMANATHGDPRSSQEMSVEFIEANTGCTDVIDEPAFYYGSLFCLSLSKTLKTCGDCYSYRGRALL